jgi:hypothetical protein
MKVAFEKRFAWWAERVWWADSSLKCNAGSGIEFGLKEDLLRCVELKNLARHVVEDGL